MVELVSQAELRAARSRLAIIAIGTPACPHYAGESAGQGGEQALTVSAAAVVAAVSGASIATDRLARVLAADNASYTG